MEMNLKLKRDGDRGEVEDSDGQSTAFIVGAVLLAATFWASPSMGIYFAIALVVCVAACAVVLLIAGAIGFCDSAMSRAWHREDSSPDGVRHATMRHSRAASA